MAKTPTIRIENVLQPGKTYPVDAAKFEAMKSALLAVVPDTPPGITPEEIIARVQPTLPDDLFPGGTTAGWWVKAVQLDQEAKGVLKRSLKPVRLYRT